jgi:hypothetical protein
MIWVFLVSLLVETLELDPQLRGYEDFEAVCKEKAVFPADSPSSSVPIVHIMGKALLVEVN